MIWAFDSFSTELEDILEPLEEVRGPQDKYSGNGGLMFHEEAGVHGYHVSSGFGNPRKV